MSRTPSAGPAGHRAPVWPLAAGAVLLLALWGGPLPGLARVSFSAHMTLHLGVVVVAAPLLALGLARSGALPRRAPWLGVAITAALLEWAVVWGWHAPRLHTDAALFRWVFVAQQASFLAVGLLVWLPGFASPTRAAAAAGCLALLIGLMHMSMLGVLLTTAPRLIYPPEVCGGLLGLSPLDDQRLGGAMMAAAGGPVYLAGAAVLARRLLAEPEG